MVAASKQVAELTPFGYALAGALGGVFSNAYAPQALSRLPGIRTDLIRFYSIVYPLDTCVLGPIVAQKHSLIILYLVSRHGYKLPPAVTGRPSRLS